MDNEQIATVAFVAFIGGVVSALLGWLDSGENFVFRKFFKSFIVSIVAAVGIAVTFQFTADANSPVMRDYFGAFLAGAGVDALSNRIGVGKL